MMPCKLFRRRTGCLSCVINIRHVGVLIKEDDSGMDKKFIAAPPPHITRRYESIHDQTDP